MIKNLKIFLKLIRVHQWIKNLFIFIPLIFSGYFLDITKITQTIFAVIAFCFIASAVYIFNDIRDLESDRNHPKKKNRPIASGAISPMKASIIGITFIVLSVVFSFMVNSIFLTIIGVYMLINIIYSLFTKHVPVWDIIFLASFYIIRVVAGGIAIQVPLSSWLLLTTFFAALFLGSGKRYIEVMNFGNKSRKVLSYYNNDFLTYILHLSSFCTVLFYSIYTTTKSFLFEISIVFVVMGFLMYFFKLYQKEIHEDPVLALLKNKSLIIVVLLWAIYLMILIWYKL